MDHTRFPRGRGRGHSLAPTTPQHPVRQPINARNGAMGFGAMGFGVIGSGLRTANAGIPLGYNADRSVGPASALRASHGVHPAKDMSGPGLMQAAGVLLPYNGHPQHHDSGTDQQFALDTNGMVRHLFASGSHENPGHRRTYTPTEEQLALSLRHLGLVAGDNSPTAAEILDIAQRRLMRSMDRRDADNEPGLSDSFSVSNGTEPSEEPRTPIAPASGFGYSPPTPSNQGRVMGNELFSGRPDNLSRSSHHPRGTSQIDPYIPPVNDYGFFAESPDGKPVWTGKDNDAAHSQVVSMNGSHRSCDTVIGTPIVLCPSIAPCPSRNEICAVPSSHDSENALKLENEQLRSDLDRLEQQAYKYQSNLNHACQVALKNITVREAEIASLKRQLRQEGLRPYNEPEETDDAAAFYESELAMLFRMVSCWAKRFYKFPTTETLGEDILNKLRQVCEDWHNECYLMTSERTKFLVVVAMATRMLAGLFEPAFLDEVVSIFLGNPDVKAGDGLREIIHFARLGNPEFDDLIYDAFQEAASKKAGIFVKLIRPLMSRMTDKTHAEQTHKQFVQVTQHAARIVLGAAKKEVAFNVQFFHFGERFSADIMKDVTADNLGSDAAAKIRASLLLELRGAWIRLCMLPYITVSIKENGDTYRQVEASKANVLLL
ncbi:hypothetical protein BZA05DRAFT_445792 [Tricharina praecox]|uniref:uncharacterized protein n=1 Tax=Tricharina praecox TaxID=43433 RepID=UPI0022202D1F|nr:uncharacterized protein BZA05DRAFT_445792 [Tricharina praecox]KAI5850067.1 hypothetical protein BZA05DRAFT_445792 [Tricharina praecox]